MMGYPRKIKGSVMGLVITISMLVTLMSVFFMLRSGLDTYASFISEQNDQLLNNAGSGLQWLLSPGNPVPLNGNLTTDLFGEGTDSVYLERKTWGAFEIVTSKAFKGKKSVVQSALIGAQQDSLAPTLYICDFEKPIAVCGNTRLSGKCYVPATGFKRAYIEGQNYQGTQYIYGTQLTSKRELPRPDKNFMQAVETQLRQPVLGTDSTIAADVFENDSIVQPFGKRTIVISSAAPIHLAGLYLEGNIKINAPKIYIASSCRLKNILLLGDEIEIEDRCTLQVQVFAKTHIEIGKEVTLTYPSVLMTFEKPVKTPEEKTGPQPQIHLGEKSGITGDIVAWKEEQYLQNPAWIALDRETTVKGNVYVNGWLDVKGKIHGSTYCQVFYLKTNSGIYENHLLNAELDASQLPPFYTGANILHEGSRREVLEWL